MKQFEGYVDPALKQFLDYEGPDMSAEIGDEYKEIELEKTGEDSYEAK